MPSGPEPRVISWHAGGTIRVRHDDERLGPYSPGGAVIRNAVELATDLRGLELVLNGTVGDRYGITVRDSAEGVTVGLRVRCRPMTEQSDVSQAWANADARLPSGWRVEEFRKDGMRWAYAPSAVAPTAADGRARSALAENAGDPWTIVARGPGGEEVTSRREPTPDDAMRSLVDAVEDHIRRQRP